MASDLPKLLPTSVVGSHALPGWFWTAIEQIEAGNYGLTDTRETYDNAVDIAIMDQERAGVDIVTDGEMRRWYFVQSFYKRVSGIVTDSPLRRVGVYGYDSPPRYRAVEKVEVAAGLGIVEEFKYARTRTRKPLKATCPGPLTLSIHIRPGDVYSDRLELAWEFSKVINRELRSLQDAGADFIQLDEPSFAIIPGAVRDWVSLYNASVEGIDCKLGLHICFGNLAGRPRGKRRYEWMFPDLLEARADQFVLEFANREMCESDLFREVAMDRELGVGVVDVKSFYPETAEDVADRIRQVLKYAPPEKLWINPDCGFFQLPRWLTCRKLEAMVAGTKIVRGELE